MAPSPSCLTPTLPLVRAPAVVSVMVVRFTIQIVLAWAEQKLLHDSIATSRQAGELTSRHI